MLWHLLRHGRRYDVVHTCSFPYFSLLAAALARPLRRYRLVVDWFEVWSRAYWREYLGASAGASGALVQRLCVRVPQHAFCFSELHAAAPARGGPARPVTVLRGLYAGPTRARRRPAQAEPLVRVRRAPHPREARPGVGRRSRWRARAHRRACAGESSATGPSARRCSRRSPRTGSRRRARARLRRRRDASTREMRRALCLLLPSRREGYGLVVVEASARGTPSVVVAGEDNAAVELVEEGVNGFVAPRADPRRSPRRSCACRGRAALRERDRGLVRRERAQRSRSSARCETVLAGYGRAPD